jgi:cytoskeletal protein CcmA (bactofilin family)
MLNPKSPQESGQGAKALTIIGPGTTITGDIQSNGMVRIEGNVSGKIQSSDSIVVQESGKVEAELRANSIAIAGKVKGNILANERLEINTGATVIGDIMSPRIAIADGVAFEGKVSMQKPGAASAPKPAPAPAKPEEAKQG